MKTQEQSSTLKEEVPKNKQGLLDKYEKEPKKEVTKETTKLPQPTGWRMLVLPFTMKEKTPKAPSAPYEAPYGVPY